MVREVQTCRQITVSTVQLSGHSEVHNKNDENAEPPSTAVSTLAVIEYITSVKKLVRS